MTPFNFPQLFPPSSSNPPVLRVEHVDLLLMSLKNKKTKPFCGYLCSIVHFCS